MPGNVRINMGRNDGNVSALVLILEMAAFEVKERPMCSNYGESLRAELTLSRKAKSAIKSAPVFSLLAFSHLTTLESEFYQQ